MTATNSIDDVPKPGGQLRNHFASLLVVAGCMLCLATVLTLLARQWWLGELLANLRMQLTIALLVIAIALAYCRCWKSVALQLLCIGWHVSWFASGLPSASVGDTLAGRSLTLTTANVNSGNQSYADIEAEVLESDSDVVAIVELSDGLARHLSQEFLKRYPYAVTELQDSRNFGIGLYSKVPFQQSRVIGFGNDSVPSIAATMVHEGQPIHVLATHTLPPMGAYACQHRNRHLRLLAEHVWQHQQRVPDVPVVVLGDLNLTPWSPVFIDLLKDAQLTSAAAGRGWTPTWYAYPVFPFGLVLDHVLMTNGLCCHAYAVGGDVGSDHRFVTAQLTLRPPVTQTGLQLSPQP